jgi:hypothetical protein
MGKAKYFIDRLNDLFEIKHRAYLVVNNDAQFFSGLKGGLPVFSESYDDAKPLYSHRQFRTLQSVCYEQLHKEYIEHE